MKGMKRIWMAGTQTDSHSLLTHGGLVSTYKATYTYGRQHVQVLYIRIRLCTSPCERSAFK